MNDSGNIKIVIITGDSNRHRYFAQRIANSFSVVGIVSESKTEQNTLITTRDKSEVEILENHFNERTVCENELLGHALTFPKVKNFIAVPNKGSNSNEVFEFVKLSNPDIILLYGSSIIKNPLLSFFDKRIVNLHLGLSPYYRGSGTNFWPFFDGLPECVGATIHLATLQVDAGNILSQVRPEVIKPSDRIHELGTKAIISGVEEVCRVIPHYINGNIALVKQNLEIGKVFRKRDFTYQSLLKANSNLDNGLMDEYLNNKTVRDSTYPIHRVSI